MQEITLEEIFLLITAISCCMAFFKGYQSGLTR